MHHDICYIACNCNPTPTAVDWGNNNLICYASCNSVRIYDPNFGSGGKITATLISHTKRVNSVRWLRGLKFETELISGSTDHTAVVWTKELDTYKPFVLRGHESNVNLVDGLRIDRRSIVVTVGMDSNVIVWERLSDEFTLTQKINFGLSICVAVRISLLPVSSQPILACALDNSKIELYVANDDFKHSLTLKGHEDWVRSLDFTVDDRRDLVLASSSQDCYIRLWRFSLNSSLNSNDVIQSDAGTYNVSVDSILTGHEGWVYSINWSPDSSQLLSASIDKSMIIWELDSSTNLWVEKIRVGEVGGNTLGFYGGLFGPEGNTILAHNYQGAFHIWNNNNIKEWQPSVTIGGHFGEVTDLAWAPQGEFLVSVSTDQTTRIHASWSTSERLATWHELARPQIHGYDLSSIAMISRYKFASSAEEKVIRTFQAPKNFADNFQRICNIQSYGYADDDYGAEGASVPSLGLSNKAVFLNDGLEDNEESHFTSVTLDAPPTEETLLQNTLWPEVQKLYGHGYEVYSLTSSSDGQFLASACKATTPEHAAVLLWDTDKWKLLQKLFSHTLTVVQMEFSPNSQHLLTVSRDRRWSLFTRINNQFELVATTDKRTAIHTRIIWCCSWSHDSKFFTTGSRDGKVVVWTKNASGEKDGALGVYQAASDYLELKNESVTAVAFAPKLILGSYFVAVGLETGIIHCFKWSTEEWHQLILLEKSVAHHLTVRRLVFKPIFEGSDQVRDNENELQLASCSSDFSVIVHNFIIK